jgi:hypothetical protein
MKACPHCGGTLPTRTRRLTAPTAVVETFCWSTMPEKALYAHYKLTAPYGDLRFFLRRMTLAGYGEIESAAMTLRDDAFDGERLTMPRAEFYRRFTNLQNRWRRLSNYRAQYEVAA